MRVLAGHAVRVGETFEERAGRKSTAAVFSMRLLRKMGAVPVQFTERYKGMNCLLTLR